jgi:two-component system phosphate regulon sensor histidine kinase PhoR
MPIESGPIDVEQLLQSATDPLRLWAELREIRLTWSVAPEIGALQADRVLTERVLINLLSNAVKFSTTGSEVSIRVEPDHASAVTFRVRNQGAGIPPDQMRRIFEKFVQVGAGSTQSGSGLGLSFCRLAVEAQGGRIWAESEVGQWTEFIFTLPLQAPILVSPQT